MWWIQKGWSCLIQMNFNDIYIYKFMLVPLEYMFVYCHECVRNTIAKNKGQQNCYVNFIGNH